jgi:hypothetical protein
MMNPIEKDREVNERQRQQVWDGGGGGETREKRGMITAGRSYAYFFKFLKKVLGNTRRRWGLCILKYPKKAIKRGTTILFAARASRNMATSHLARR